MTGATATGEEGVNVASIVENSRGTPKSDSPVQADVAQKHHKKIWFLAFLSFAFLIMGALYTVLYAVV